MAEFRSPTVYYYCPDYKKYVKREGGMHYIIENGKEIFDDFYSKIEIGSIYAEDISEDEYNAQLY